MFKYVLVVILCLTCACLNQPGTVYVVYCIDTEPDGFDYSGRDSRINLNAFATGNIVDQAMQPEWRDLLRDSQDSAMVISWYLMTTKRFVDQNVVPAKFLANFGERVATLGDEIGWHFHADWPDSAINMDDARSQFAEFVYSNRRYPVSFRAGWLWEDNRFSNWLDSLIPFDYSNNWLEVENQLITYHPDVDNLYTQGSQQRLMIRSVDKIDSVYVGQLFDRALSGEDVILSYYTHNYGSTVPRNNTIKRNAQRMHDLLLQVSAKTKVPFRYTTATSAVVRDTNCSGERFEPELVADTVMIPGHPDIFGVPVICYRTVDSTFGMSFGRRNHGKSEWMWEIDGESMRSFVVAYTHRCGRAFVSQVYSLE